MPRAHAGGTHHPVARSGPAPCVPPAAARGRRPQGRRAPASDPERDRRWPSGWPALLHRMVTRRRPPGRPWWTTRTDPRAPPDRPRVPGGSRYARRGPAPPGTGTTPRRAPVPAGNAAPLCAPLPPRACRPVLFGRAFDVLGVPLDLGQELFAGRVLAHPVARPDQRLVLLALPQQPAELLRLLVDHASSLAKASKNRGRPNRSSWTATRSQP